MTITPVQTDEGIAQLARLHAACFTPPWPEQTFREMLKNPGTAAFAASPGFVVCRVAADEAEVLTIGVAAEARRRGLGAMLLCEAARWAGAQGARAMFVEAASSNPAGLALYRKFGFRRVGQRASYYGPSDHAVILRADLPLPPFGISGASIRV
jgi:ribosomal-protein-alanine N-acetyltransferase